MSNTNTNLKTQTSNALHNVIIEACGKDRPPMLAPDQLNAEAEVVQIILTRIDNDIYFTVNACPNACEMWKAIERKFTSRDGESLESYYSRFYKMMNELIVSYHKLYDILKQHQNEVNVIRAERLARTANPLALVAQQQPVYHPKNHPNHYTQNSSNSKQQAATRNRGKAIVKSPPPTYNQEPTMIAEDDKMLKEKEIDKLMALISLSFKKIYKPTNNNLRTSSNTSKANQDNTTRINRGTGYDNHRAGQVAGARENVAYHKDKMLLCKQEEAGFQLNAEKADWRDDNAADNSGPIFHDKPLQKVQNDNDNYNVFANDSEHLEQPESDEDDDLARERDLLVSLIEKLKCEIDDSKIRNKFLESSNKTLVDKLKGEIEDFKNKNKSLESSNNHFKEANNELSKTNQLMFKDLKKFQAELDRCYDVNYMSKVELDYAKAKAELMSYKTEYQKSINNYSHQINDLNQKIFDMKKELVAH
ncbi:hypothetical protein Tco_0260798 [Tanacetum coccineum]